MTKRVSTKIGDLFSVEVDGDAVKYFQLIAFDSAQLNSDVIRTFEKVYPLDCDPDPLEVVSGEVSFYAHCVTRFGVKMNLWKKVGTLADVGDISKALFRGSDDSGSKVGQEPIKVSDKWYVWRIGDADYTYVGSLEGANREAEIGLIVNPFDIAERIKTGKYSFFYPSFR